MTGQPRPPLIVPPLREDLRLMEGADGQVLIYDPLAHRYLELRPDAVAILRNWRGPIEVEAFAGELSARLGRTVEPAEVLQLAQTLDNAALLSEPLQGWRSIYGRTQANRKGPLSWLLHNYLFIRIPLVKPDSFLARTQSAAALLASRPAVAFIGLIGLIGLYLAMRQWDQFTGTFLHFFSFEGAIGYLVALALIKVLHELGHAYTARAFGCRVPSMGLAFMVLMPVLYTDVTDAWRLKSRRERLLVSAAGILTELGIAAIALFLWAILPEGFLKSAAFFVATVSLVSSIVINISPLMRFDGYYIASDYWGIPNLQPRSFALMRWKLREVLFNLGAPCPEDWPAGRRAAVILYAITVCIYRLFLFIGIALLVYHMTFKILGIILFAVEIIWFVLRPIAQELRVWWSLRGEILSRPRYRASLTGGLLMLGFVAFPWPHRIEIPAIVEPAAAQKVVVPYSAQILSIKVSPGAVVKEGDVLFSLHSPKLDSDLARTQVQLAFVRERYQRRVGDSVDRDATLVLEKEIAKLEDKVGGLRRLREDLDIKATTDGVVREVLPDLHDGRWVQRGEELATVLKPDLLHVRGYVSEEFRNLVAPEAMGRFVPESIKGKSFDVRLETLAHASVEVIDLPYLRSTHGGSVAVNEDRERGALPVEAQYQAVLVPVQATVSDGIIQRGIVSLEGQSASLGARVLRRMAAILIRESGF